MASNRKFLCGVPKERCSGAGTTVNAGMYKFMLTHGSSLEAFKCHAAYLRSLGYQQIGSREFSPPDGGPVRVLTKKGKFGGTMRGGKTGGESKISSRFVPKRHGKSVFGGVIIST